MTWPVRLHKVLQRRLREMLEALAKPRGFLVDTEYPYRPLPESEVWGADVACVAQARDDSTEKWLMGSPELVIEVLSPSNTKAEIHEKAVLCLSTGTLQFWVVDPKSRQVKVSTSDGRTMIYKAGQQIPLLSGGAIAVSEIFE